VDSELAVFSKKETGATLLSTSISTYAFADDSQCASCQLKSLSARTIARLMAISRDTLSKSEMVTVAAIEDRVPLLVGPERSLSSCTL